ncbi:uncharacterized protein JN550_005272 [Neoarthrinium moseri]|uniref:uncharacterized protein n=1 Tax=Neoarthrinium moseri TaxID=1658444 RepID=UPI001FDE8B76|nr:uncharacterized protein JN550_005272 [Neoarthrinium moseri]KAI1870344.1 hypothetical protein JN550_005272 [Neoarthrinium moseri]
MDQKRLLDLSRGRYSQGSDSDEDNSLDAVKQLLDLQIKLKRDRRRFSYSMMVNGFQVLVILFLVTFIVGDGWPFTINFCLKRVNTWSPILDQIKLDMHEAINNGSIWDSGSPFQQGPSEEADKAWHEVTALKVIPLTGDGLRKMGRNPDEAIKIPPEWGMGDDLYPGFMDSQHLLHCLWRVRTYSYFPYYWGHMYPEGTTTLNMSALDQAHLNHCLSVLVEALTCQPSMQVETFTLISEKRPLTIDWRTNRKCVNHGRMLEWQSEVSTLEFEELKKIPRRPEQVVMKKPEGVSPELSFPDDLYQDALNRNDMEAFCGPDARGFAPNFRKHLLPQTMQWPPQTREEWYSDLKSGFVGQNYVEWYSAIEAYWEDVEQRSAIVWCTERGLFVESQKYEMTYVMRYQFDDQDRLLNLWELTDSCLQKDLVARWERRMADKSPDH